MPDTRRHRGAHPDDRRFFTDEAVTRLRAAVTDLSWLLSRGYADTSSSALVGNRYRLSRRQRMAMRRMACADQAAQRRRQTRRQLENVDDIVVDGFNVIITVESALGGAPLFAARDGCYRDLAGLRGSYRIVAETEPAVELIGRVMQEAGSARAHWLLDAPVSNSGRLRSLMEAAAERSGWNWEVEVLGDVDRRAAQASFPVATSDSAVLDQARENVNLAREVVVRKVADAWVVGGQEAVD